MNNRQKRRRGWNSDRCNGSHSVRIHTGRRSGNGTAKAELHPTSDTPERREKQAADNTQVL